MVTKYILCKKDVTIYYKHNTKFLLNEQDIARNRQNSHAISKKCKNYNEL